MMNQRDVWESLAKPWNVFRKRRWKEVADFLEPRKGIILDIGCGSGRNFIPGRTYVGIDFSVEMLRHAREGARKRRIKAMLIRADATALPLKPRLFDTALFIAVLHVIERGKNRKKALRELRRVLKKGGAALITVWNRDQPKFNGKKEAYVPWTDEENTYQRYYYLYGMRELNGALREAGFIVEQLFGSEHAAYNVFPRNIVAVVRSGHNA